MTYFSKTPLKTHWRIWRTATWCSGPGPPRSCGNRGRRWDWLINPFNRIVAKLIQVRFWGTRLTDVGCTYRALRTEAYHRLRGTLWVCGNHFSPHMFIQALKLGMRVIEVPIVFRQRGGESKGVGSNKMKAARVAVRMLGLIYTA